MEAEHFPLSRGSRQRTGRAVGRAKKEAEIKKAPEIRPDGDPGALLTFSGAAVLLAGGPVNEAVGVAPAAAVVEELALHGGHVEEVLPQQGTTGTHLWGKSADLGDFWRERWE